MIRKETVSTESNSVSVCTMALTMLASAWASGREETSPVRLMRALPLEMSRSSSVPSGMTVRRPRRAASMSLRGEDTMSASVALATPVCSAMVFSTGTRYP